MKRIGIERINYVFETATNDKKMTARDTALFHLFNPNGIDAQVRAFGWDAYDAGGYTMGLYAGEWDREKLEELAKMKKPRWWNVRYHVNSLKEEATFWGECALEGKHIVKQEGGE